MPGSSSTPSALSLSSTLKKFSELSTSELYEFLALRQIVFTVEQICAYLDCDGKDQKALHLQQFETYDGAPRLVAYARIFAPGVVYEEACIGRIVTHPDVRRTGRGRALVRDAIVAIRETFGDVPIRISAQAHLERFYEEFEFSRASDPYLEDEIPHIEMLRPSPRKKAEGEDRR